MNARSYLARPVKGQVPVWLYHWDKAAHTALIALLVAPLAQSAGISLLWVFTLVPILYTATGKLIWFKGKIWKASILDVIADTLISALSSVGGLAMVYGLAWGLTALGVWALLYAAIVLQWRWASP